MQAHRIDGMFHFSYTKPASEIVDKMLLKVLALKNKIEERKVRIVKIKAEYKITDAIYIDLLEQAREALKKNDNNRMSYSVSSVQNARHMTEGAGPEEVLTIGAGVVNNLLTETDFIRSEESQVEKLEIIARNLKDEEREWSEGRKTGWSLSETELKYLGF